MMSRRRVFSGTPWEPRVSPELLVEIEVDAIVADSRW
jgi:hypothetical protein